MAKPTEQKPPKGNASVPVRIVLVTAGSLCLAAGIVGIFLPVLPTTPFLILAAGCYARGSPGFHRRLLSNRVFGDFIRNYKEGRSMKLGHKLISLLLLWLTLAFTGWFAVSSLLVRLLLLGVGVAVTAHLLLLKTTPRKEKKR